MTKKIMVCDDDAGILEMIEMILEEYGYQVLTVINSVNVLKGLEEWKPDLLLLDIWMPVLSGDQVLKSIRSDSRFMSLPVIMYSASSEGRTIAEASGAQDYLEKPFDIEELEAIVKKYLD